MSWPPRISISAGTASRASGPIGNDGYVKVLDFGIARLKDSRADGRDRAAALPPDNDSVGAFFGTVSYMSPEQARRGLLDTRTDLFSLGILLYELLAGCRPFAGDTEAEVLNALCTEEPRPLRELRPAVPRALEEVVGRLLRKNPDEHYQTAGELLEDLKRLRGRAAVTEGPAPAFAAVRAGRSFYLRLRRRRDASADAQAATFVGSAFRSLLPFQESDREHFYGRRPAHRHLTESEVINASKMAILLASLTAGAVGFLWLKLPGRPVPGDRDLDAMDFAANEA